MDDTRIDKRININSPRLFLPPQLDVLAAIYDNTGVLIPLLKN